jgi:hypothetical protein
MKEYICVEVTHYSTIAEKIKEFLDKGWHLHTYQATGSTSPRDTTHYLLFERG